MDTGFITEQIISYMFERADRYTDYLSLIGNGEFNIVYCGQHEDAASNFFRNTVIEIDGLRQKTDTAVFSSSSEWLSWVQKHKKEAEDIGLVIVAENDAYIDKYSYEPVRGLVAEIPEHILLKINALISSGGTICINHLSQMEEFVKHSILARYVIERIEDKHNNIINAHTRLGSDWGKTFIFMLFDTIAISNKRNRRNFNILAQRIGYDTILQHLDDTLSIEALLFGTAGLLRIVRPNDDYTVSLIKRFAELSKSYKLEVMDGMLWDMSTVNASNSLCVIIAQLATILVWYKDNYLSIANDLSIKEIFEMVSYGTSPYWYTHEKLSGEPKNPIGERIMSKNRQERVIINGIIPFLFAFYKVNGIYDNNDKLLDILEKISGENNQITRKWEKYGVKSTNSMVSQAVIQIEKLYCRRNLCAHCKLGRMLIG